MEKARKQYMEEYQKQFDKINSTKDRFDFWHKHSLNRCSIHEQDMSIVKDTIEKIENKWHDSAFGESFPSMELVDILEFWEEANVRTG